MKLRAILKSGGSHVTSNEIVGLFFAAALFGPLVLSAFGSTAPLPLALPGPVLFFAIIVVVGIIYLAGVKARQDHSLARFQWEMTVFVPCSILFGWLTSWRSDPFFTAESLHQVSAVLLVLSIVASLLERSASRGTPSDVLANATSTTAVIGLLLFWMLVWLGLQPAAAVLMLLSGILIVLTVLLRMPGAVVPIYRARWRRRRRRGVTD